MSRLSPLMFSLLLLAGCGQSGDLYLPDTKTGNASGTPAEGDGGGEKREEEAEGGDGDG